MDPNILKIIHLAGALGVFTAMGAIALGAQDANRKLATMLHGISLLLLLLAGFAILRKPPMELHYWKVKVLLWLFLGVAPVLARRKLMPGTVLVLLTLAAGILAAYLGVTKAF